MLEKTTIDFLTQLSKNNNRPWFKEHDAEYRAAKANMEQFVEACIGSILSFDKQVMNLTPKEALFRIHRDVRFSKNKQPYKEWFAAVLTKDGRKYSQAGYYVRVHPKGAWIGGGFHGPQPDQLARVRKYIQKDSTPLRKAIKGATFKKYFGELQGEQVKTAPKGFSKDDPNIDLLRYKSFFMMHEVTKKQMMDKNFPAYVAKVCKAMRPVNDYINTALGKRLD